MTVRPEVVALWLDGRPGSGSATFTHMSGAMYEFPYVHKDGRPFSHGEVNLAMQATADDLDEVAARLGQRIELRNCVRERTAALVAESMAVNERIIEILRRYPSGETVAVMDPREFAEFRRLEARYDFLTEQLEAAESEALQLR